MTTTPDTTPAFALRNVGRSFRFFRLEDISLTLPLGQVMGLVGPNGAGKSTTIRLLMGMLAPETGTVELLGHRMPEQAAAAKAGTAYVSDDMRLFGNATLGWHMAFTARLYPDWDEAYARHLLKHFNLREAQGVRGLSRGEHMKALLLLALARRPRLMVLDEPTSGLDPVARHELLTELMQVVRDDSRSILFSSHNTLDVERICDQIAFIDRGRLVEASDRDSFLERWRRLSIDVPAGVTLPRLEDVVDLSLGERMATLVTDRYEPALHAAVEAAGARVTEVQRMSLEEIFVATVVRSRGEVQS